MHDGHVRLEMAFVFRHMRTAVTLERPDVTDLVYSGQMRLQTGFHCERPRTNVTLEFRGLRSALAAVVTVAAAEHLRMRRHVVSAHR